MADRAVDLPRARTATVTKSHHEVCSERVGSSAVGGLRPAGSGPPGPGSRLRVNPDFGVRLLREPPEMIPGLIAAGGTSAADLER